MVEVWVVVSAMADVYDEKGRSIAISLRSEVWEEYKSAEVIR